MSAHISMYPVAIVEDRYSGVYSSGRWVAIAQWENDASGEAGQDEYISRLRFVDREGNGDDTDAMTFWSAALDRKSVSPFWWVAVGETPNHAWDALIAQHFAHVNAMTPEEAKRGESL